MNIEPGSLAAIVDSLRDRLELGYKRDIQLAASVFGREGRSRWYPSARPILNGDDTAALDSGGDYVLFAAEGMRGEFVAADPWFAGFCGVMTNVNDVAAMGGRPWAVVDVLFLGEGDNRRVLEGMAAAGEHFGVPVVGGHTTRAAGPTMLAVAVVGRARRLIPGSAARPGQSLLVAVALEGSFRGAGGNFDAVTTSSPEVTRSRLALLPNMAEDEIVRAGKDVSMAGFCGTLLMMLEASGCGATFDVARLPAPPSVDPLRWLAAFPSFGFVLTVESRDVAEVRGRFERAGVACAVVGEVTATSRLDLEADGERVTYADWRSAPLTGFGG